MPRRLGDRGPAPAEQAGLRAVDERPGDCQSAAGAQQSEDGRHGRFEFRHVFYHVECSDDVKGLWLETIRQSASVGADRGDSQCGLHVFDRIGRKVQAVHVVAQLAEVE